MIAFFAMGETFSHHIFASSELWLWTESILAMHLTLQKAPLKGNCKDEFCCYYPGRGWGRAGPGPGAGVPEAEGGGDDQPAH